MSTRKLIGGITLGVTAGAAHLAIRFGALGTDEIHLVDNRRQVFEYADQTANYLSVKHHHNIFYDKLSYWRDGNQCLPETVRTYKPMRVSHTKLDGVEIVIKPSFGV
jgi:hypothetical protein